MAYLPVSPRPLGVRGVVIVAKVPDLDPAVTRVNVVPVAGSNPVPRVAVSVPLRLAAPVADSLPKPLVAVPVNWSARVPSAGCVKAPVTDTRPLGPRLSVPSFVSVPPAGVIARVWPVTVNDPPGAIRERVAS